MMKSKRWIVMKSNYVGWLNAPLALVFLASPLTGQLNRPGGDDMKTLLGRALQLPVTPWENPDLIPLRELMRKDPDGAVRTVEETIGGLDLRNAEAQIVAQRAVQLLGCVRGASVLKELDALYSGWKRAGLNSLRNVSIQALDSCPVSPPITLIREQGGETTALLTSWLMTENDSDVVRTGLRILSTHSSSMSADLVRRMRSILPDDEVAVAMRKAMINALKEDRSLYLETRAWIEEIIAGMEQRESQSAREYESETDLIHFLFRKLHEHPAAGKGHAEDFGRLAERIETRSLGIGRSLGAADTEERRGSLRMQRNQAALIRDYLLALASPK